MVVCYARHPYVFTAFRLFFSNLPPTNFAVVCFASKGRRAGRMEISVPSGAVTLTFTEPTPVTDTQPRPGITTSDDDCPHPSPST